jgi:hypothetical protein
MDRINKKYNLTWVNARCEAGWNSTFINDFGIFSIPYNILIDNEGLIIGYNLDVDSIETKIKTISH